MANNKIFREKSLQRIASPEELHEYVRVTNPKVWTIIVAVIILLFGVCVWGKYGHLSSVAITVADVKDGQCTLYVSDTADVSEISVGQPVKFDNSDVTITVTEVNTALQPVEGDDADEIYHVMGLEDGTWVYIIKGSSDGLKDGIYQGKIITNEEAPESFLLN